MADDQVPSTSTSITATTAQTQKSTTLVVGTPVLIDYVCYDDLINKLKILRTEFPFDAAEIEHCLETKPYENPDTNESLIEIRTDSSSRIPWPLSETETSIDDVPLPNINLAHDNSDLPKCWRPFAYDQWLCTFTDDGRFTNPVFEAEVKKYLPITQLVKAKNNYHKFQDVTVLVQDLSHVLEFYDFPTYMNTVTLRALFRSFLPRGLHHKWVDETHCLLVFHSKKLADEALNMHLTVGKVRPIAEASQPAKDICLNYNYLMRPPQTYKQRSKNSKEK